MAQKEFFKIIQDSVHGPMEFHPLLVKIIDSEELQRLRHIKQLSMTTYVYPSATHCRFQHSLGVCHLANTMLEELRKGQELQVSPQEILCVQIAGLCHDLGHGPFSHTWELFVNTCGREREGENWQKWEHEAASALMLDHMLKKNDGQLQQEFSKYGLEDKHIKLIKDLITGPQSFDEIDKKKIFLFQIVANKFSDMDVDKFDYFLRDGRNLGIPITSDHRRLQKFCKVMEGPDGRTTIAYRDKAHFTFHDIFRMRRDLHIRAYQHKVSKCLELMLIDALRAADSVYPLYYGNKRVSLSMAHENMETFQQLSDHVFMAIMNQPNINMSQVEEEQLRKAKSILHRIVTRELYQFIGEWRILGRERGNREKTLSPLGLSETEMEALQAKLKVQFNCEYGVSQININHGKFKDPAKNIMFYDKRGGIHEVKPEDVAEGSLSELKPFIKVLVYCKDKECDNNIKEVKKVVEGYLAKLCVYPMKTSTIDETGTV